MTLWIPKGEFPALNEDYRNFKGDWKGNILAYRTEMRQQRVIHLQNLYRYMYYYLTEEGWVDVKDDSKNFEVYYLESRKEDSSRSEMRIWWRMKMGPGFGPGGMVGTHPFLRYLFNVDFLCYKVKRIEIVHQGRTIKPYMGDITIWFTAILELDYCKWFEKEGGLMDILKEYFVRRIYKRNIREHEIELRRLANRYVDDFKHFIGLLRYKEDRKLIHPAQGMY
ncbi:hypothetical protein JXB41_07195 [Candidatus Woesearchaeota archaeon]|nr:hypothetical protein [Candidatus Woesearchaeota archaeon]